MSHVCIISLGWLKEGSWKLMDELDNPDLRDLASKLPNTILHSRADSTVKKYLCAYRRWKLWAETNQLSQQGLTTLHCTW